MKKQLLIIAVAFGLLSNAMAQKSASLVITKTTKYQYIDGFGGTGMNGQWGDVYTQAKVNKLWGQGEDQIGLNIMRIRINPNEGNWGEYGNAVKWARKANPNVQVFATPWTPPKKWKTSKAEKYKNEFGIDVWPLVEHSWGGEGSNGGTFNDKYVEEYADFFERYRQTMEKKGCPIDIISIQNECNYTPTATDNGVEHASYESCIFSPKQMAAIVKATRAKVDPKCKIMGPETFGWGQSGYNKELLKMTDATNNIDIWGNHIYGSMKTNQWGDNDYDYINTVTSKTKKHMWMTEFLIDYPTGYDGSFSAEKDMIESIEYCLTHGYNGYVYYNMLNDFFACCHGGSENELWKRAYVFGHYAKYATGRTRVKHTLSDGSKALIGGSSYISQSGDTVTTFIHNPTNNTYTFTIRPGIDPTRITQAVTNASVNSKIIDITDKYTPGSNAVKVTLLPNSFYTFEMAVEDTEETDVIATTSPKTASNANPINPYQFIADPTAIEYEGRLYVYGTNDQQEFNASDGLQSNTYGKINQFVCMSTEDMVNWTNHGTIDVKAAAPWIYTSWAPSIVSREENDGKTHFYMYFTNSASGIGVLTATSPLGPWKDPLGKALIDGSTKGLGTIGNIIDPGACINPETGVAYLTFGGGDIKGSGTELQPGNARIVKLGDDMISLASDIKTISAPCHFEANELNFIGSKWVFSYCTRWSIASNWKEYSKSIAAPSACSIVYMTANDPLEDKWTFKGAIATNPGANGYPYGNNHSHIQKFGSAYYFFYHTQGLENALGYSGGYRNLQCNRVVVAESNAKIATCNMALLGASKIANTSINPFESQQASQIANAAGIKVENSNTNGKTNVIMKAGDWTMVRDVNFATDEKIAQSLTLNVSGAGTIELRLGSLDGTILGSVNFDESTCGPITITLDPSVVPTTNQPYLYFVCTKGRNVTFNSWSFSADSETSVKTIFNRDEAPTMYLTTSGTRIASPQRGINIVKTKDGVRKVIVR